MRTEEDKRIKTGHSAANILVINLAALTLSYNYFPTLILYWYGLQVTPKPLVCGAL